ncbi:hypothetical protein [Acidocella sp.]|uniref:hypothetical protein n=1 Tax=Acidocella sp. TaxID=50710 RepID=UPI003D0114AB
MPQFDVQGALAAGYSPTEIANYMASQPNSGFDVSGARKAGYSDNEIIQHLSQAQPSTSPVTALRNSAGSIVSGLGNADKTIGQLANKYAGGTLVGNGLQTWADTAGNLLDSAGQAISGPQQYDGQSIHRLGSDLSHGNLGGAAYDAVGALASAAPYAATAALDPAAGAALLATSGAGNTIQAREAAQGEQSPSAGDLVAGGASAALNAIGGPMAHGVLGGIAGRLAAPELAAMASPITRAAARVGLGAGAGAATGAANYALDNAGTGQGSMSGMANAAVEGAGTGALATGGTMGAGRAVQALQEARTAQQAGPHVQAYAQAVAPWNSAVQQAVQGLKAANPNMDDAILQQTAQAKVQQQGVQAPAYDSMTPQARAGMAELGLQDLYQKRLQAETAGMGRSASTVTPANTFKGVMDDISSSIQNIGASLVGDGTLTPAQGDTLNAAVKEAARNNRNPAQGGQDAAYFNTLRDQVAALPLDKATSNTLLLNLQMLDMAQQNSVKMNSRGPLQNAARWAVPLAGAVMGAGLGAASGHGGIGLGLEGLEGIGGMYGLAKMAGHGALNNALATADQRFGFNLPPILRNAPASQAYAARMGLPVGGAPGDMQPLQSLQAQARQQAADNQAQQAAQVPPPLTPVQKGQDQAARSLATTLGNLGDQHPVGFQAMQDLSGLGRPDLIAQAMAKFNSLGGVRGAQDQMAQQQAAQQAQQASQNAITRAQVLQAAKGNAQAVKDQGFLAKLQGRTARSNALAVWQPQGTGGNARPVNQPTGLDMLTALAQVKADQQAAKVAGIRQSLNAADPLLGTHWQRAASAETGVPVTAIQDYLQGLHDTGGISPEAHTWLNGVPRLPADLYGEMLDRIRAIGPGSNAAPSTATMDQSGVRNQQSYGAAIRQHDAMADDIRSRYPDMADKVNALVTIKTAQGRQQALAGWLNAERDPNEQARLEEALGPLAQYGWKPSSGTPHPDVMAGIAARISYQNRPGADWTNRS